MIGRGSGGFKRELEQQRAGGQARQIAEQGHGRQQVLTSDEGMLSERHPPGINGRQDCLRRGARIGQLGQFLKCQRTVSGAALLALVQHPDYLLG